MNKILRVGLFLALLAICYADTLAQEEEKGLFKRFIELFSLSSNPTYENGKYMPLEKHHAAFAEKSSEINPEGFLPTDGQVEESPVKDSVADVQKDQNWDKNSYIETSSTQATEEADKTQILKSAKAEKKRKIILAMVQKQNLKSEENQIELKPTIFKESKKSRLFKPENKNIVLTQTQTGTRDDPPPQQPQGGTIEDSKTAASIDALKTQIKDDVDKATDDMKDDMKKNNEELKAQLKAATDDLKDQIVQSQKNITTVVKNESRKVQDEIKKDTKMLKKEVDIVGLKVDDNLVQTIKLRIMALQDQLEQKQALLADITAQANELRSQLPPPKTICDTFFDCSTCAGNPKCGWCIAEQKCVEGDKIGPLHMSCNFYDYGICSGGGCSRYKDCDVKKLFFS